MNVTDMIFKYLAFPCGSASKESAYNVGDLGSIPVWVGKISWIRESLPTPVFWPGEFHGQKSLTGYSPGGHQELATAEQLSLSRLQTSPKS